MTQGQNEAKPRPLESTPLLALPAAVSFTHVAQLDLLPQTKGSPCPFQAPGSILEIPTEPFFHHGTGFSATPSPTLFIYQLTRHFSDRSSASCGELRASRLCPLQLSVHETSLTALAAQARGGP